MSLDQRAVTTVSMQSDEFLDDPLGQYGAMREQCPVIWSEPDQYWIVTSMDAVRDVMQDAATFSNEAYRQPGRPPLLVLSQDPPIHTAYRRLLLAYFAPAFTEQLRPKLEAYSEELFDRFTESGQADLVIDYGNPIPALVVLEQCGLPTEQWWQFAEPNHAIFYEQPGTPGYQRALAGMQWIAQQLAATAAQRRAEPRDDLTSHLATATVDGELLPLQDVAGILMTIVGGGVDTTTSLYANAVRYLSGNQEARTYLQRHPDQIPDATEEFLRRYAPAQAMSRMVRGGACVVAGQTLDDGDHLRVSVAAANHDETTFPDADSVRFDRAGNRHASFGLGIHRCIGSHLARAMLHVMIRHTLERVPDYVVDTDRARPYRSATVNGWVTMPATFTPTPKRATTTILPPTG
jgi:cytochrome P450